MALKFVTHFEWIAIALDPPGADPALWDEEDGFYYDVMRMPDGSAIQLKVRSLVGLLPLCAATVFDGRRARPHTPRFMERIQEFVAHLLRRRAGAGPPARPEPGGPAHRSRSSTRSGCGGSSRSCSTRRSSSARTGSARSRAATSSSRACSTGAARSTTSHYLPAESDTGMFGGNSNWRGPVWFPMNLVILRGLLPAAPLLRRPAQGRVPDRLRARDEPARGRDRDQPAPDDDVHRGRARAPAGVRRHREVPDRPALARPAAVPRVLPRRQRRRHRRQPPDRVDRDRGAALPARGGDARAVRRDRRRRRADRLAHAPAAPPDRLRDQHRGLAAAPRPRARALARARRGARRRVGRARGAARRRRLADGRLAAQPGRPADRAGRSGAGRGQPRRAPRPPPGGRDRLALLRARLRRRRALRRSRGAGGGTRAARRAGASG